MAKKWKVAETRVSAWQSADWARHLQSQSWANWWVRVSPVETICGSVAALAVGATAEAASMARSRNTSCSRWRISLGPASVLRTREDQFESLATRKRLFSHFLKRNTHSLEFRLRMQQKNSRVANWWRISLFRSDHNLSHHWKKELIFYYDFIICLRFMDVRASEFVVYIRKSQLFENPVRIEQKQ